MKFFTVRPPDLKILQGCRLPTVVRMVILFQFPTKVYDETIPQLQYAVRKARIGNTDKVHAIKKLPELALVGSFLKNIWPVK